MNTPLVSVIVVNWNGLSLLDDCFESLRFQTHSNYEVIMVDNGSVDGSVEHIKSRFPWVRIIQNPRNLGLSIAYNIGIKESQGQLILLANNDIIAEEHFLEELVKTITISKEIGIVGGKIISSENPRELHSFPVRFIPSYRKPWSIARLRCNQDRMEIVETDIIGVCAMMVKREVIEKTGLLDESYFVYFNEDDFCLRAKRAGFKLLYNPRAIIWHKGSATMGKVNLTKIGLFIRGDYDYRRRNIPPLQIIPSVIFAVVFQLVKGLFGVTLGSAQALK